MILAFCRLLLVVYITNLLVSHLQVLEPALLCYISAIDDYCYIKYEHLKNNTIAKHYKPL